MMFVNQRQPGSGIASNSVIDHDDGTASAEQTEEVIDGEVKIERRDRKHTAVGVDTIAVVNVIKGIGGGLMGHFNAFGFTGRAGGEDDIRRAVW
ncbi:hypothetical protein GMA8713_05166 [Grimontia marina]|uniref:Uncharacterized protein n=1 Tax=Grimontia marina TaxID=646534 RepID=A0A128FJY9_9GAMM|nr:hypothetical protein GMA8713_05166 [Grimontia marina]